ncbi:hypothetical protein [Geminisphaera colitermitum]|uniref:hypothetical protein n=1 Tax=Geminisphaera colitermitum TaxID=1148786 RepID=UPI0001964DE2|nr:hypothetical protein [Geminisphaera colitermitum]
MSVPPRAKKTLIERVTSSVPLLVTVIIHVILILIAGAFVVQEQILKPKKKFEAAAATESTAQKQIEHRLQVARKSSATASSSTPISANRIYSSAEGALQLPEMPDLPSMGAGGFGGFGSGVDIGAGTGGGMGGVGNTSLGGRGFMSLSFLGMTSQNVSKIVFVLDIGTELMDIRKGGFPAFQIIREQIMQLVNSLPPSAEFGVVLFETGAYGSRGRVAAYRGELMAANVANKEDFFRWLTPINTDAKRTGIQSVPRSSFFKPKPLPPNAGIDPLFKAPDWAYALHMALEMQPDTVYIITGSQGTTWRRATDAELAKRKRAYDEKVDDLRKRGIPDIKAAMEARRAAYAKARRELDAINEKLKAQGKQPLVARVPERIFQKDFQAELTKLGYSIKLDGTGWTDKDGKTIGWVGYVEHANEPFSENYNYISRLQAALVPKRATINVFLFVGPNEQPKEPMENLGKVASRNNGRFELLTTKRLEELKRRAAEANK